jgi:D-proline reductase (dithiol) PrdB
MRQKKDKIVAKLLGKYPSLFDQWAKNAEIISYDDSPWAPLEKDVSMCRLALITTGGVHLKSQAPFDMFDRAGDPTFREIPADASTSELTITHNYYDRSGANKDVNVVFPFERILELKQSGEIGDVNHRHFSFMGHIMHPYIDMLVEETAPRVAAELKSDDVDIVILTPA